MWGPWRVGMAASNAQIQARFQEAGLTMLSPKVGIQLLEDVMAQTKQLCTPVLAEVAWTKLFRPDQQVPSLFSEVVYRKNKDQEVSTAEVSAERPAEDIKDVERKISAVVVAMLGANVAPDQVHLTLSTLTFKF